MKLDLTNISVLCAEDNQEMLKVIRRVLEGLGFGSVTTAKDGQEAFDLFKKDNHDMIISDLIMEPVSGFEFLEMTRTSPDTPNKAVPFIFLTGHADAEIVKKARDKGVTEFIIKPFTVEQLSKRITSIMNKPRDFVETETFVGPDRRRRREDIGVERRKKPSEE